MVIWSIGLGTGLQTQLGGFDSYYHLNGFGGNPRIDDESMSTKMPRGQVTGDGSYLFLEWLDTISRYEQHSVYMFEGGRNLNIYLPRWRNGSVFVLHTNGGGSIPSRGTKNWVVKVVRIRQPDCKSGPFGSGSSPLLPTMIMVFSISRMSTIQDRSKNSHTPCRCTVKLRISS